MKFFLTRVPFGTIYRGQGSTWLLDVDLVRALFPSGKEVYGRKEESETQDEKEVKEAYQRC